MNAEVFWNNVKPLIKANKLTQLKLSELCNIPFGTLQGWIAKSVLPDVVSAFTIAKALNTSVEYLVTGEESSVESDQLKTLKAQLVEYISNL